MAIESIIFIEFDKNSGVSSFMCINYGKLYMYILILRGEHKLFKPKESHFDFNISVISLIRYTKLLSKLLLSLFFKSYSFFFNLVQDLILAMNLTNNLSINNLPKNMRNQVKETKKKK